LPDNYNDVSLNKRDLSSVNMSCMISIELPSALF